MLFHLPCICPVGQLKSWPFSGIVKIRFCNCDKASMIYYHTHEDCVLRLHFTVLIENLSVAGGRKGLLCATLITLSSRAKFNSHLNKCSNLSHCCRYNDLIHFESEWVIVIRTWAGRLLELLFRPSCMLLGGEVKQFIIWAISQSSEANIGCFVIGYIC